MTPASRTDSITFLFTDVEGSTRLWEEHPEQMRVALAHHDAILRAAVAAHRGTVVKMSGDGVHAAFGDALDAIQAALALQDAMARERADGLALGVRCGLHLGIVEARDNDYFGRAVNRAARVMSAAHGGQVLVSRAIAEAIRGRIMDGASLLDLGVVRLRDLAEPERVYQLVHPRLRREFPALRSLESTPNNLPHQLSSFIGREREVAEIAAMLRKVRLLTLHGTGGLGKTRLSLQVAADLIDDYPDGVWLIELAPVSDPTLVSLAVATVLGLREEPGGSIDSVVAGFLGDRQALLILDNCEHLVEACAKFARELLESSRNLKLLATSREPLHLSGESSFPVPAFAIPDARAAIDVGALIKFDAIRLFVERASAVQPSFQLSAANAAAIIDICRQLDGIPLAIELAAARVRALSIDAIRERLADRFRLLTRGDGTLLPRQQTLRALIDWSHDLLSAAERVVFQRLAVFAGGWTLEAAESVCAGGTIDEADILDLTA
ncbi:MAG: adenylate/guanylate cyclase domain-containing protein, partial [Betaproteobacteria bacterium]